MNTLLAVFTLLLLGTTKTEGQSMSTTWASQSWTSCTQYGMEQCIRDFVNCRRASECGRDAKPCGESQYCYQKTPSCRSSLLTLESCGDTHGCKATNFNFKYVIENKCIPPVAAGSSLPRLTVFVGFSAVTLTLLTYFSKE